MSASVRFVYPPNWNYGDPISTKRVVLQVSDAEATVPETGAMVLDISELLTNNGLPVVRTVVEKIEYSTSNCVCELYWDRRPAERIAVCSGSDEFCYKKTGGLTDPSEPPDGPGDILLNTSLMAAVGSYNLTLFVKLKAK